MTAISVTALKKIGKKIGTGAVIAATALGSLASVAQAGDWGHGRGGHGYRGHGNIHGYGYHRPSRAPHYGYHQERRDRRGEKIATGVAIGVGALILGSILANQARRDHGY